CRRDSKAAKGVVSETCRRWARRGWWREPFLCMPPAKGSGAPDAGNPHVRCDTREGAVRKAAPPYSIVLAVPSPQGHGLIRWAFRRKTGLIRPRRARRSCLAECRALPCVFSLGREWRRVPPPSLTTAP